MANRSSWKIKQDLSRLTREPKTPTENDEHRNLVIALQALRSENLTSKQYHEVIRNLKAEVRKEMSAAWRSTALG